MQAKIDRKTLWQFFKFGLVGCSNSAVTLLVYYACIWILGTEFYLLGQTIGYIAAVINSFGIVDMFLMIFRLIRFRFL